MSPLLVAIVISVLFALAGAFIAYLLVRALRPKLEKPETIDVQLLRKYEVKKEVDDEDRESIFELASVGLMRIGLSENARITAEVTADGRKLLWNAQGGGGDFVKNLADDSILRVEFGAGGIVFVKSL